MNFATLTSSVKKTREALKIRQTALADLTMSTAERMADVQWANRVVEREAHSIGKSPEWLIAACGY